MYAARDLDQVFEGARETTRQCPLAGTPVSRNRQSTLGIRRNDRPGACRDREDTSPSGDTSEREPNPRGEIMEESEQSQDLTSRRSFLLKGAAVGAASLGAGGLLLETPEALARGGG